MYRRLNGLARNLRTEQSDMSREHNSPEQDSPVVAREEEMSPTLGELDQLFQRHRSQITAHTRSTRPPEATPQQAFVPVDVVFGVLRRTILQLSIETNGFWRKDPRRYDSLPGYVLRRAILSNMTDRVLQQLRKTQTIDAAIDLAESLVKMQVGSRVPAIEGLLILIDGTFGQMMDLDGVEVGSEHVRASMSDVPGPAQASDASARRHQMTPTRNNAGTEGPQTMSGDEMDVDEEEDELWAFSKPAYPDNTY